MPKSLQEYRQILFNCNSIEVEKQILKELEEDSRLGAKAVIASYLKKKQKDEAIREKYKVMLSIERDIIEKGYHCIAGIDEVGRGPLAGPVVAACVIFPNGKYIEGVDDSKRLTKKQREKLYDEIVENALAIGIGRVEPGIIDSINILNSTKRAMKQAIENCPLKPDYLLIDAVELTNCAVMQSAIVKGDAKSHTIAAASIVAKVIRDREMEKMSAKYPYYQFEKNMGYGTQDHISAIAQYGLSPIHRRSFCMRFCTDEKHESR